MNSKPQFLTIEEKRAWLAHIFRDTSGFFTAADKLKALEADNRLVMLQRANCQETLDSSSSKPTVDTLKTCGNCAYYSPFPHRPDYGKCIQYVALDWVCGNHDATNCRIYEPEQD